MSMIFVTDLHLSSKPPGRRREGYLDEILGKLERLIYSVSSDVGEVSHILLGGDIFNNPNPSYEAIIGLTRLVCRHNHIQWVAIPGQHDSKETDDWHSRSPLGILDCLPNFGLVNSGGMIIGVRYRTFSTYNTSFDTDIVAVPYFGLDTYELREKLIYAQNSLLRVRWRVVMVHALITNKKMPFKSILLQDLGDCGEAIFLCGDYHGGFPITSMGQSIFVNPGSFARLGDGSPDPPRAVIIDKGISLKKVECLSASDVFCPPDRDIPPLDTEDILYRISGTQAPQFDIFALLEEVSKKIGASAEALDAARKAIQKSQVEKN